MSMSMSTKPAQAAIVPKNRSYRFTDASGNAGALSVMPSKRCFYYVPALPYGKKDHKAKLWMNWEVNREWACEMLKWARRHRTFLEVRP
jgi:hypothetical protein